MIYLAKLVFTCALVIFPAKAMQSDAKQLSRRLTLLENALNVLKIEISTAGKMLPPVIPIEPIKPEKEEVPQLKKGELALIQADWIAQQGDIKQLKVLTQIDGANCGYHALKNAILILNAILAGSNKERAVYLNDLTNNPVYRDWFVKWSANIATARAKTGRKGSTDWLQGNEIELLIKGSVPEKLEHSSAFITVIDNPDWLTQKEFGKGQGLTEDIVNQVAAYQNSNDYFHVFILANSREYQNEKGFIQGTWTHWITVAVNKVKGQSQFIILDSANHSRTDQQDVQTLINTLKKGDLEQLKMQIQFSGNMNSIIILTEFVEGKPSDYIGTPNDAIDGIMERVTTIITKAKDTKTADGKTSWLASNSFKEFKNALKDLLGRAKSSIAKHIGFYTKPDDKLSSIEKLLKEL